MKHSINIAFLLLSSMVLLLIFFSYPVEWWLVFVPLMIFLLIAGIGSFSVCSNYHVKALCSGPASAKKVAITFDDGPTPETEKVLDLLKQFNTKATFFCIGAQIQKYPEIFKRIINEGHTVGNHTYTHSVKTGFFSTEELRNEIALTNEVIEKRSHKKVKFFRPPYGVTTPNIAKALKITDHTVIGWNVRSLDTVIKETDVVFKRIKGMLAPGSIILLHDTSERSVNVLEQLLVLLQKNNYEAVTVDELLNIPAYEE